MLHRAVEPTFPQPPFDAGVAATPDQLPDQRWLEDIRTHGQQLQPTDITSLETKPEPSSLLDRWCKNIMQQGKALLQRLRAEDSADAPDPTYFTQPRQSPKPQPRSAAREPAAKVAVDQLRSERRQLFVLAEQMFAKRPQEHHLPETTITIKHTPYRLIEKLGQGAYGVVWRVHDQAGKSFVLKLSRPVDRTDMFLEHTASDQTKWQAQAVRSLLVEVAALDRLTKYADTHHSALPCPRLHTAQWIPDPDDANIRLMAIVMEEIPGDDLGAIIPADGFRMVERRFDDTAVDIVLSLIRNLQIIHAAGVIHSDIKSNNIRLAPRSNAVTYIDFGGGILPHLHRQPAVPADTATTQARQRPLQRHVWGKTEAYFGTKGFAPLNELPSMPADAYALGRTIQHLIFGDDFNDHYKMIRLFPQLSPKLQVLARLANRLTAEQPNHRATLEGVLNIAATELGTIPKS